MLTKEISEVKKGCGKKLEMGYICGKKYHLDYSGWEVYRCKDCNEKISIYKSAQAKFDKFIEKVNLILEEETINLTACEREAKKSNEKAELDSNKFHRELGEKVAFGTGVITLKRIKNKIDELSSKQEGKKWIKEIFWEGKRRGF